MGVSGQGEKSLSPKTQKSDNDNPGIDMLIISINIH